MDKREKIILVGDKDIAHMAYGFFTNDCHYELFCFAVEREI